MTFKVGDRVIYNAEGDKGTVKRFEDHRIWVSWDETNEAEAWVTEDMISKFSSYGSDEGSSFEENVRRILNGVADTIVAKNESYGDAALNPIRVFSKADRIEQLNIRLDDKLSRVQRGSEFPGDDTLRDIIGYVTLMLIARESQ